MRHARDPRHRDRLSPPWPERSESASSTGRARARRQLQHGSAVPRAANRRRLVALRARRAASRPEGASREPRPGAGHRRSGPVESFLATTQRGSGQTARAKSTARWCNEAAARRRSSWDRAGRKRARRVRSDCPAGEIEIPLAYKDHYRRTGILIGAQATITRVDAIDRIAKSEAQQPRGGMWPGNDPVASRLFGTLVFPCENVDHNPYAPCHNLNTSHAWPRPFSSLRADRNPNKYGGSMRKSTARAPPTRSPG